jgi:gliding motility-associated-like protein
MKALRILGLLAFLCPISNDLFAQINANFNSANNKGCAPLNVTFTDSSTSAVKWEWDFGNGNKSILQNPSALYLSSGQYNVRLIVEDSNGKKDTLTKSSFVIVFKNPVASILNTKFSICEGDSIHLVSNSILGDAPILSYTWDFGDGSISKKLNPSHVYSNKGTYDVTLIIKDTNGCESFKKFSAVSQVKEKPIADFLVDKNLDCGAPVQVNFRQKCSKTSTPSYSWNFGNNTFSSSPNPSSVYQNLGSYGVHLKVTDINGCSDSIFKPNAFTLTKINANFSATNNSVCANQNIQFLNTTSPSNLNYTWTWNFGNNKTSTQKDPQTSYSNTGNYNVKLFASISGTNCKDSVVKNNFVKILNIPNVRPVPSDTLFCDFPKNVSFTPSSLVKKAFYSFTNSPYDTSSKLISTFNYTKPGKFDVNYTYEDFNGCIVNGVLKGKVEVEQPTANILGQLEGCIPHTETFKAKLNSKFPVVSYKWFLNGVLVSSDSIYTHAFTQMGKGELKLIMVNSEGCVAETIKEYAYGTKTNPDFEPIFLTVCMKEIAGFKNITDTLNIPVTRAVWKFGDEEKTYNGYDGKHTFTNNTNQKVTLITYNYGCPDTITKIMETPKGESIIGGPKVKISYEYDTCSNVLKFENASNDFTSFRWKIQNLTDTSSKKFEVNLNDSTSKFKVQLWATNANNNCPDDSTSFEITPIELLKAQFSYTDSLCAPAVASIRNISNNSIDKKSDSYFWFINQSQITQLDSEVVSARVNMDYNKGNPQTFHPELKFGNSGTYEVMLIAERHGCMDTMVRNIFVKGPHVSTTITKLTECTPLQLQVINNKQIATENMWIFNRKDTVYTTEKTLVRTFYNLPANNQIEVILHERDAEGCIGWKKDIIKVNGPSIDFNSKLKHYCDNSVITFDSKIQNPVAGNIYNYTWELETQDTVSSLSNQSNFEYNFVTEGDYLVNLTVRDQNSCASTISKLIHFNPGQLDARIISDTLGSYCPPLLVSFFSNSVSRVGTQIIGYKWDFGDNTFSDKANPQKTYTLPGSYTVKLEIKDNNGCVRTQEFPDFILVKGPVGEYNYSPLLGCAPLKVNFNSNSNSPSNKVTWDLGNGMLSNYKDFSFTYKNPGSYTPLMILEDTLGCSYVLPPKEPIVVNPTPIADFTTENHCFGDTTRFIANSSVSSGKINNYEWSFNNNKHNSKDSITTTIFSDKSVKNIELTAVSDKGCKVTVSKPVKIFGLQADASIQSTQLCLGNTLSMQNISKSDTTLVFAEWTLNNGEKIKSKDLRYIPTEKGIYKASLQIKDILGCSSFKAIDQEIIVGDTLPSSSAKILSVSVVDNSSIQLRHTKSHEFDFKSYKIYENTRGNGFKLLQENSNPNDTTFKIEGYNTLHNTYCFTVVQNNICNVSLDLDKASTHCTVEVSGQGDTNVSKLKWNAYKGWDEVETYTIFRRKVNGSEFDSIATVSGNTLTYNDSSIECYTDHFYRILAKEKNGYQELSWSDTCRVIPIYHNIVPSPLMKVASVPDNENIEILWHEVKNSRQMISHYVLEKSNNGTHFKTIDTIKTGNELYYFDTKKLDVQNNSYIYKVKAVDVCGDVSAYTRIAKTVVLKSYFNKDYQPVLYWTKYQDWKEGVSHYIIEQKQIGGEFVKIGESKGPNDTVFVHHYVQTNCIPEYVYRVIAVRNKPIIQNPNSSILTEEVYSISNHTKVEVISTLFAPSAFSPNGDGLNDIFEPKGVFISDYHIEIFNRWGEKLWENTECFEHWNGYYDGALVQQDVYIYKIRAIGADGKMHHLQGDVTIIIK